jgi:hypothetical protein
MNPLISHKRGEDIADAGTGTAPEPVTDLGRL